MPPVDENLTLGLIERQVEALLFVSPQPVAAETIAAHLGISAERAETAIKDVARAVREGARYYAAAPRRRMADGDGARPCGHGRELRCLPFDAAHPALARGARNAFRNRLQSADNDVGDRGNPLREMRPRSRDAAEKRPHRQAAQRQPQKIHAPLPHDEQIS